MCVKCIQGHNVRKKGQAAGRTKVDAFLAMVLGSGNKAVRGQSAVHKKSNEQPNFQGEVVAFDVVDVASVTDRATGDVVLHVELLDAAGGANTVEL